MLSRVWPHLRYVVLVVLLNILAWSTWLVFTPKISPESTLWYRFHHPFGMMGGCYACPRFVFLERPSEMPSRKVSFEAVMSTLNALPLRLASKYQQFTYPTGEVAVGEIAEIRPWAFAALSSLQWAIVAGVVQGAAGLARRRTMR